YGLPPNPSIPTSIFLWKDVIKPLGILGFWGSVAAVLVHYINFGARKIEDDDAEKGGSARG
ncbi:MAG: formate dehydrogenase N subunit beta transmembrane domain-containing protein, partial [Deltaproteobacteria bacterium]